MHVSFPVHKRLKRWLKTIPSVSKKFKCDGCSFVSDKWFGIDLFPACELHDWCYLLARLGILEQWERKPTDRVFRHQTYYLMVKGGAPKWYARYFAYRRYIGVRLGGRKAFKRDIDA